MNIIFLDKDYLQDLFKRYAIKNGYQHKVHKSMKSKWEVKYLHEQCRWHAQAIRLEGCDYFQLPCINT